jgi:hypothetical protein
VNLEANNGRQDFLDSTLRNSANSLHDDTYYQLIKIHPKSLRMKYSIYFGKIFATNMMAVTKTYGNPMGVEATEHRLTPLEYK